MVFVDIALPRAPIHLNTKTCKHSSRHSSAWWLEGFTSALAFGPTYPNPKELRIFWAHIARVGAQALQPGKINSSKRRGAPYKTTILNIGSSFCMRFHVNFGAEDCLESQVAQNNRPVYSTVAHNWLKVAHNQKQGFFRPSS